MEGGTSGVETLHRKSSEDRIIATSKLRNRSDGIIFNTNLTAGLIFFLSAGPHVLQVQCSATKIPK